MKIQKKKNARWENTSENWNNFCQNNLIAFIFFSDFLMAVLREAMLKNPQLKLILMSATLDTELFLSYFDNSCHIQGYYTKVNSKMLLKTCI